MLVKFTPIAGAVALFFCGQAYAAAGAAGAHGTSSGHTAVLVGDSSNGQPGTNGADASGSAGGNITGGQLLVYGESVTGAAGSAGADVVGATTEGGGAGAGGHGGASVIGGISRGAAAGSATDTAGAKANGGAAGAVTNSSITVENTALDGSNAAGGAGGKVGTTVGYGATGQGGQGGGSVVGGISQGAAGGQTIYQSSNATTVLGGAAGDVTGSTIRLVGSNTLEGGQGGDGGTNHGFGGTGTAGHGGGSVLGGLSQGGAGGSAGVRSNSDNLASGGAAGNVTDNTIVVTGNNTLKGAAGGSGGGQQRNTVNNGTIYGGLGASGHGGGSVFGGISQGGAGGSSIKSGGNFTLGPQAVGASGGAVSRNTITLSGSTTLEGAKGGSSALVSGAVAGGTTTAGGVGAAGHGGGSVFGGISQGGAGGGSDVNGRGGNGGVVSDNQITLSGTTILQGAAGGDGMEFLPRNSAPFQFSTHQGGGAAGGVGGGSVVGGISQGGAGGYAPSVGVAHGGAGGDVTGNTITISGVSRLLRAQGGQGSNVKDVIYGGYGADGRDGGSVFGGISQGGAGGAGSPADGGAGGDVTGHTIHISGDALIEGDIYGGFSQGGAAGDGTFVVEGRGGNASDNTITLVGQQIRIGGSIFGGLSVNGPDVASVGKVAQQNLDPTFQSFYQGNALNLKGFQGAVDGIYNIERYQWELPQGLRNGEVVVHIRGQDAVQLDHTKHQLSLDTGNVLLRGGDTVILLDKVQGTPASAEVETIKQGFFVLSEGTLAVESGQLVLKVTQGADRANPVSKTFLEGHAANVATVNHGADMISDQAMAAARDGANGSGQLFIATGMGKSRYATGSHIDVRDTAVAIGASKAIPVQGDKVVTVGAFVEHGRSRSDTYNDFGQLGVVRGQGDTSFTGGGLLAHLEATGGPQAPSNQLGDQQGLYVQAAVRAGTAKSNFATPDLVDKSGAAASYTAGAPYVSAMVGGGYVILLDEQSSIDVHARASVGMLKGDSVQVGKDTLKLGDTQSARLRVGARYNRLLGGKVKLFAGVAAEQELRGAISGSVYGVDLPQPSLKGLTGIVEVGASLQPLASHEALSFEVGGQSYFGMRQGVQGSAKMKYAF